MKKKSLFLAIVFCFSGLGFSQAMAGAKSDPVLKAMVGELNRSYKKLKNAEKAPLYFLQYEVFDKSSYWVGSNLGAITSESDRASKSLTVDARVGSYELDNSHEVKGKESRSRGANSKDIGSIQIPFNDEDAIKTKIWELTDKSYKEALDKYLKVVMNKKVTAKEEDKSGDFSLKKRSEVFYQRVELSKINKAKVKGIIKRLSAKFKKHDFIINSNVGFYAQNVNKYIVNSEGSQIVTGNNYITVFLSLGARTKDGMDLSRSKDYAFDNFKDMPSEKKLSADLDILIKELEKLTKAKDQEPFTVPAILNNRSAAVFFHEIFGHRIEGHRQKSASEGQTFAKKVGQEIMPSFLSVYDDPSMHYFKGQFLRGYYEYDDEAVKSKRVDLVENGVLKGFLMSRIPIDNFPYSNGHGRRSEGKMSVARQGNLIIKSRKEVSYKKLKKLLMAEIKKSDKPYGLIIKDISGGFTITQRILPQSFTILIKYAVKVYSDGRPDEIIRGLNMIGTPLQTFQKIIYTGDDPKVFNGTCGAESGWVPVSAVSPSLLFSEVETEKVKKSNEKPPILRPPYFDGLVQTEAKND
ncbi:MAG: metallopeptidase TldD-related protein [Elusimicrobiota bacterium]|nr:metallopeptidase TldD-related protein [Elusimicrobiota bacterium]